MGFASFASFVAVLFHVTVFSGGEIAADSVAIVRQDLIPSLHERLQTSWRLVSFAEASPEDLHQASAVVPEWTWLRNQSALDAALDELVAARLLQLDMTGYDLLDVASLPGRLTLCNVLNMGTAIPEYVLAAMLSWNVRLPELDAEYRRCTWHTGPSSCEMPPPHRQAQGQTVGILGYGTIGQGVAQRAAALGMRAIAVTDPAPGGKPPAPLAWIGNDTMLPQLMRESDFVVVSLPLLPSTRGLIGATLLAEMKPQAVLINVARAAIVDEDALYDALVNRRIGGAILDVWWQEQIPGAWPSKYNFSAVPKVWMTPHSSFNTAEAREEGFTQIAANFDALARGQPLHNVVRGPTEVRTYFSLAQTFL